MTFTLQRMSFQKVTIDVTSPLIAKIAPDQITFFTQIAKSQLLHPKTNVGLNRTSWKTKPINVAFFNCLFRQITCTR